MLLWTSLTTFLTKMHSSGMRTARSSSRPGGFPSGTPPRPCTPPGAGTPRTRHPPVDRHTPVNILPCPKLRLRAVMIWTTFIKKINGLISFEAKLISYSFAKNHVYWYFADERKLVGGWRRERRYLCSALIRKLRKSKINALFFGFSVRLR